MPTCGNLYGYTDYDGPSLATPLKPKSQTSDQGSFSGAAEEEEKKKKKKNHESSVSCGSCDDDDDDPLRVGHWMEGDSLSPPLGSSLSCVHGMLRLASATADDVLWDLGCGDGRICLEAHYGTCFGVCRCVGVELEGDLLNRFRYLLAQAEKQQQQQQQCTLATTTMSKQKGPHEAVTTPETTESTTTTTTTNTKDEKDIESFVLPLHADLLVVLAELVRRSEQQEVVDKGESSLEEPSAFHVLRQQQQQQQQDESEPLSAETLRSLFLWLPLPTIITCYLLPEAMQVLQPHLALLLSRLPNLRIVCNTWGFQTPPSDRDNKSSTRLVVGPPTQTVEVPEVETEKETANTTSVLNLYTAACLRVQKS